MVKLQEENRMSFCEEACARIARGILGALGVAAIAMLV